MARIDYCESIRVARKVLVALNGLEEVPGPIAKQLQFESFSNCREQGYCIKGYLWHGGGDNANKSKSGTVPVNICIARTRGGDDIVVYHTSDDFVVLNPGSMISNTPDWDTRRYFKPDNYDGAARYITKLIKEAGRLAGL